VYFSIFGGPREICGGCDIRYVAGGRAYTTTSAPSGAYQLSLPPGPYTVQYSCPSPTGGVFWVNTGSITLPPGPYGVDVITEGCI